MERGRESVKTRHCVTALCVYGSVLYFNRWTAPCPVQTRRLVAQVTQTPPHTHVTPTHTRDPHAQRPIGPGTRPHRVEEQRLGKRRYVGGCTDSYTLSSLLSFSFVLNCCNICGLDDTVSKQSPLIFV